MIEMSKRDRQVKEMGQTFVGEIAKMVDGTNKLKEWLFMSSCRQLPSVWSLFGLIQ